MKIIFMGTPEFAAVSLRKLVECNMEIGAVFCQPDKASGRGNKIKPCAVKEYALSAGLPVYQPDRLREESVVSLINDLSPDLIAVVAYGKILPEAILSIPRYGCVNAHASLLPKYRGSAPIQHALLNGEKTTGVTTMYLNREMDAGDMIFSRPLVILPDETSDSLFERLAPLSAELLLDTVRAIEAGTAPRVAQDPKQATFAPMISRELSPIDWTAPAEAIRAKIYALQSWPCATARFGDTDFKIFSAHPDAETSGEPAGTVLRADKTGLRVVCGDGKTLCITELQASGGKRMSVASYLLGHKLP